MAASGASVAGSRILADSVGPGGTAAIVVLALILALAAIFVAMFGSLRRLRQNASTGAFDEPQAAHEKAKSQQASHQDQDAVTPDPGPGGAGA